MEQHGIETIRCDLIDEQQVAALPDAPNVMLMTGMKFGSASNASLTWAMNDYAPMLVARRYRNQSIVAFSTGNVYGLTTPASGGSLESDTLAPIGEYAMSVVGRESLLDHFSRTWGIPMALLRLNYACDLRYGVAVDIATRLLAGQPIDLTMGYFNTIWQGDANAMALCAFGLLQTPPHVINMTGPEVLSIREVAQRLARRMNRFCGVYGHGEYDCLAQQCALWVSTLGTSSGNLG